MNGNLHYISIFAAVFILWGTSCAKLISDEFPDFKPIPTLNTILVEGKPILVHISLAEKIDTTDLDCINEAIVEVSSGSGEVEILEAIGQGFFRSAMVAQQRESYTCTALLDGYPELIASDTVPGIPRMHITSQTNYSRRNEEGVYMEGVSFEFYDNPGSDDFYEVIVRSKKREDISTQWAFNEMSEILLNEGLEPYTTPTLVFNDELIKDSIQEMQLDFLEGYGTTCRGDSCFQVFREHTIYVELRHVSREYYLYKKQFYLYEKGRYPYFVEGTGIALSFYSNIENGYGVMASYSCRIDSVFSPAEFIPIEWEGP